MHRSTHPSRLLTVVIALAVLGTLAAAAVGPPAARTASAAPTMGAPPGPLTWSDEFDGAPGAPPDPARWRLETGGSGWGNDELQYYTDSPSNASTDGAGHLVITARRENPADHQCHYGRCEYTSARLITADRFAQQHGRFEARIKIPGGQGTWPAFWMLGQDIFTTEPWPASGEIDVMENVGKEPGTVWGSLHGPGYSGADAVHESFTLPGGEQVADDFHTFTVDWGPDAITWYVDGTAYSHKTPDDTGGGAWVFDDPFFLLLNLAIGGDWPGSPDESTTLPAQMVVDYVRAYAWDETDGPGTAPVASTGRLVGLGGKCLELPWGDTAPGVPVQVRTCSDATHQQWTFEPDGTVRTLGRCLDVAWGAREDGAKVQTAPCSGDPAQQFVLTASNDLVNPQADRCVDVTDFSTTDGSPVQLWGCAGTANQKWWVASP
ncbi:family 16 glycosylhydrolase [Oerskovia enterophila]|uniref:Beta-glucanase n=1 Tax=Oerskovia enterophila TaxID=43678 RepID=A0A163SKL0_9CELL|nr:family 16 glycosylhydrolase [Oerskovia enterophila]KZM36520.1 beta-glucanase precursor [Oerskovia enterophila]